MALIAAASARQGGKEYKPWEYGEGSNPLSTIGRGRPNKAWDRRRALDRDVCPHAPPQRQSVYRYSRQIPPHRRILQKWPWHPRPERGLLSAAYGTTEIGRASWRERVCQNV